MTLSFDICKKLRDAGFEQNPYVGRHFYASDGLLEMLDTERAVGLGLDEEEYVLPTLEELVEACEELDYIEKQDDKSWAAVGYVLFGCEVNCGGRHEERIVGLGDTMVGAVANLYIQLNSK